LFLQFCQKGNLVNCSLLFLNHPVIPFLIFFILNPLFSHSYFIFSNHRFVNIYTLALGLTILSKGQPCKLPFLLNFHCLHVPNCKINFLSKTINQSTKLNSLYIVYCQDCQEYEYHNLHIVKNMNIIFLTIFKFN